MKKLLLLLFFSPLLVSAFVLSSTQVSRYFAEQNGLAHPLSPIEWLANKSEAVPSRPRVDVRQLAVSPEEYYLLNSRLLGSNNAVAARVTTLSGSGVSASAASIGLTSFKVPGADIELGMSDFGDLGCGTLEPGNSTRQEFVSFTGITQSSSDSTATLTGVTRGLSPVPPYTASTTQQRAHSGGSQFVISNSPPCFYEGYANRTASTTVVAKWIFDVLPEAAIGLGTATTSRQFATKQYADNVIAGGAATSTETNGGKVELGTLAEQASSTDNGANQPTVLQTKNSTSTCQVADSYNIVASSTTGKLDENCLDVTATYNYSGNIGFSSTTPAERLGVQGNAYISGTTTTSNLNVASSTISINGSTMRFPSTLGASSTLMSSDGTNAVLWVQRDWELLGENSITGAATSTLNVSGIPAASSLQIEVFATTTTSLVVLRFNNDAGSLYNAYNNSVDANGTGKTGATTYFRLTGISTSSPTFSIVNVLNLSGTYKLLTAQTTQLSGGKGAGDTPIQTSTAGLYANNTAQITNVQLLDSGGATMGAGTRLRVWGRRD